MHDSNYGNSDVHNDKSANNDKERLSTAATPTAASQHRATFHNNNDNGNNNAGSGKNKSQREKAVWQKNLIAHADVGPKGTRLTFRFDVPDDCRESDTEKDDSYHMWRLNLSATLAGTDLDRDYELPVFATAQQSRFLSSIAVDRSENLQRAAYGTSLERISLFTSHNLNHFSKYVDVSL